MAFASEALAWLTVAWVVGSELSTVKEGVMQK
jgi:hypothetical protein